MIWNCFPRRTVALRHDAVADVSFKGSTLAPMVDALYILFENAVQHSHAPSVAIGVEARLLGQSLTVTVWNNVVVDNWDDFADRVTGVNRSLAENALLPYLRREGGTGLFKLRKILCEDLGRRHLSLAVTAVDSPERRFVVTMEFTVSGMMP